MPRDEEPHHDQRDDAPAMTPLTDGHTPILMPTQNTNTVTATAADDDEAELELDRRDVVERVGEPLAARHDVTPSTSSPAA